MKIDPVASLVFLAAMNGVNASEDPNPYKPVFQYMHTNFYNVDREMTLAEANLFASRWRYVFNKVHENNPNYDILIDSVTIDSQVFEPPSGSRLRKRRLGNGEGGATAWGGVSGTCNRCENGVPPDRRVLGLVGSTDNGVPPERRVLGSVGSIPDDDLLNVTQDELCASLRESVLTYFQNVTGCEITFV